MMRICQFTLLFLLLFLAACGPSVPPSAENSLDSTPALPEVVPLDDAGNEGLRVAPTANSGTVAPESSPAEEAYPFPTPIPVHPDEGYPALPPTNPPPSPYPVTGETVWVLFPVGEQCSDESRYPDKTTAVAALTAAGVTVLESEVTELIVCSACGCPTSAHYRVSIDSGQLNGALSLDWTVEQ